MCKVFRGEHKRTTPETRQFAEAVVHKTLWGRPALRCCRFALDWTVECHGWRCPNRNNLVNQVCRLTVVGKCVNERAPSPPLYSRHLRWLRNIEQGAKWNIGLTAGMFCLFREKDSLFRTEQGISHRPFKSLCDFALADAKTALNRRNLAKFPVIFPVLRESGEQPIRPLQIA
jgi:hypothetical protein